MCSVLTHKSRPSSEEENHILIAKKEREMSGEEGSNYFLLCAGPASPAGQQMSPLADLQCAN